MEDRVRKLAEHLLDKGYDDLSEKDRRVLDRIARRTSISRDLSERPSTMGERVADRVASFGGSWTFILLFMAILVVWVSLNTLFSGEAPDPYPFIFLNLMLSMLAAFQAPIIMMSQNRQSLKDREAAAHDYEVNLKAELEIIGLHEKLDDIRLNRLERLEGRLAALEANSNR